MDREQLSILKEKNPFAPLHDIISELIMQDIIFFRLRPGAPLVESSIAECFGVSRSPVRSALEMLLEKGYVYRSGRSFYVKKFSTQEYHELSQLSALIEPFAAAQAATRLSTQQFDELYDTAYRLQELYQNATRQTISDAYMPLMDMEYRFHTLLVQAADNSIISRIFESYRYRILYYRSYILQNPPPEVLDVLADDHLLICNTLKLRDAEMAEAVVRRHLSISRLLIAQGHVLDSCWPEP